MTKNFTYKSYSFIDKDPIIDYVRTIVQDSGKYIKDISIDSGVNTLTIRKMLYGETKRPQAATVNAILRACDMKLSVTTVDFQDVITPTHQKPSKTVVHIRSYMAKAKTKKKAAK